MQPEQIFNRNRYRVKRSQSRTKPGFLHEECRLRLLDRLDDIKRRFSTVLLLGAEDTHLIKSLRSHPSVDELIVLDDRITDHAGIVGDVEALPFGYQHFDAVLSAMHLHWVNDLPGCLAQIRRALKDDGLFLAVLPGGQTLHELRYSLMQAELEIRNGAGIRVPPFVDVRDGGALLQRAGFTLPVSDFERLDVRYRNIATLFSDLRMMGETNPTHNAPSFLSPALLAKAIEIYHDDFTDEAGLSVASFDLLFLTGWSPSDNQQKPLKPGSAQTRLIDALLPPDSEPKPPTTTQK